MESIELLDVISEVLSSDEVSEHLEEWDIDMDKFCDGSLWTCVDEFEMDYENLNEFIKDCEIYDSFYHILNEEAELKESDKILLFEHDESLIADSLNIRVLMSDDKPAAIYIVVD